MTTRTIETSGKTIKVTLERGTWEEEIRLDGMLCGTETHAVDRTEIALYDGSKKLAYGSSLDALPTQHSKLNQAIEAGCVGIVGNEWFVKSKTAETIRTALAALEAENPKTIEQIAIENQETEAKAKAYAWLDSDEYHQMVEFDRKMNDPNSDY